MTVDDGRFKFDSFDILTVVKHGEPLLGSAGDEFDMDDDSSSTQCILLHLCCLKIPLNMHFAILVYHAFECIQHSLYA